jgi:hypothetical protein
MINPDSFFKHPATAGQKQYEALRGYFVDHIPGKEICRRFGYAYSAFNSLKQRSKPEAFSTLSRRRLGPKDHAYPLSLENKSLITGRNNFRPIKLRKSWRR